LGIGRSFSKARTSEISGSILGDWAALFRLAQPTLTWGMREGVGKGTPNIACPAVDVIWDFGAKWNLRSNNYFNWFGAKLVLSVTPPVILGHAHKSAAWLSTLPHGRGLFELV